MKTIGMLGGMSWESTVSYYQLLNSGVKKAYGGLHSAKIAMVSVDFEEIEKMQRAGDWAAAAASLSAAAQSIEAAGADFLLICTNTMHKVAPEIEASIAIPLLHIADTTGDKLIRDGHKKIGLLGTAFTMEQEFYKGRLSDKYSIEVLTPNLNDRKIVHDIIYQELCLGILLDDSRTQYLRVIDDLKSQGAEAIVLGCTEIPLLVHQNHTPVPLYDTTSIHAAAAVALAIAPSTD
ncbi:MAG: aspartate racemase [Pseudohongiellaceae bacterium]|jgi:aspartate racemase